MLRIAGDHVIRADVDPGKRIAGRVNRRARDAAGAVSAAVYVAQSSLTRGLGVYQLIHGVSVERGERLDVGEDEPLILDDGGADAAAIDVLHELRFALAVDVEGIL